MFYFIFAALFLLGALTGIIFEKQLYTTVEAKVLESRDRIVRKNREFNGITVQHALSYEIAGVEDVHIVDCLPVREPDGAVVRLRLEKKTMEPVANTHSNYTQLFIAMILAAVFCVFLGLDYYLNISNISENEAEFRLLGNLLYVFGAYFVTLLMLEVFELLNPRIIKVKGKYEGMMHSSVNHRLTAFYSLWYGEFKQYARYKGFTFNRTKGTDKDSQDDTDSVTLYYNTKTGTVIKKADIVNNVCLSIIVIAVMILYKIFIQ